MDSRFPFPRDELYNVHMDVKHMQAVQNNHAERLSRLEKRQADDAAIKSAWNSPFPSALSGTPQHGSLFFLKFYICILIRIRPTSDASKRAIR